MPDINHQCMHEEKFKSIENEIEKLRTFRHDFPNTVQSLYLKTQEELNRVMADVKVLNAVLTQMAQDLKETDNSEKRHSKESKESISSLREEIIISKERVKKMEEILYEVHSDIKKMNDRLIRGDTQFAVYDHVLGLAKYLLAAIIGAGITYVVRILS